MAEEDEIDVLGDYNLENLLSRSDSLRYESSSLVSQNSDLLNCDYTIHPQWLLDKPSANPDNWYNSGLNERNENNSLGHVSTENCITDESGWTEKEKNLLERGIEIFGKSNIRLSQFIGSKSAAEVKYYLKNFYLENHGNLGLREGTVGDINTNTVSDVLEDSQIPASIEEVIAAVSTAKTTIQGTTQRARKKSTTIVPESDSLIHKSKEQNKKSALKTREFGFKKFKKKVKKPEKECFFKQPPKFRFKTALKDFQDNENNFRQKIVMIEPNQSDFSKAQITTGNGCAVAICEGEEIIKIKKVESESDTDIEVDVEVSDDELINKPHQTSEKLIYNVQILPSLEHTEKLTDVVETVQHLENVKTSFDISNISQETLQQLHSLENPLYEVILNPGLVTELEKVLNSEYFEGRSSKTPERYSKIRNHIIDGWLAQKPNYLNKSRSRMGLKSCGDVNCFSKIHNFLEQIGAINFGCDQVVYLRPLSNLMQMPSNIKDKPLKEETNGKRSLPSLGVRQRTKKKFVNDGEGGCTLTHDESGKVINTTIVNEEPAAKQKLYIKKPAIRLIYCRPFMEGKPQPYIIKIYLSAILAMDFHAHLSLTEVMGLVAGYWIPESGTLIITRYEPTLNMASSATHCDMCPISQAKAADAIHEMELDILGWFHSHPTFAPEPSQQDLETQQTVQQWIGHKKPCIGVILSPFSFNGALIASPYRCMIVDKKLNFENQYVPYKFDVEVVTDGFSIDELLCDLKRLIKFDIGVGKIEFRKAYFLDSSLTYLEKYITSAHMHMAKCGTLSRSMCEEIIQRIRQLFDEEA